MMIKLDNEWCRWHPHLEELNSQSKLKTDVSSISLRSLVSADEFKSFKVKVSPVHSYHSFLKD